eukprot:TRINITY_DN6912_c0_g1_i1.p1 TRINITY_DN6912_c0_g1~~TRINITY_DN6912_c0_g1_i1.p1  ORF type:complete len:439 (-),score=117.85 TRINITY_DN6912_c0_g1_i1:103-1353(-)
MENTPEHLNRILSIATSLTDGELRSPELEDALANDIANLMRDCAHDIDGMMSNLHTIFAHPSMTMTLVCKSALKGVNAFVLEQSHTDPSELRHIVESVFQLVDAGDHGLEETKFSIRHVLWERLWEDGNAREAFDVLKPLVLDRLGEKSQAHLLIRRAQAQLRLQDVSLEEINRLLTKAAQLLTQIALKKDDDIWTQWKHAKAIFWDLVGRMEDAADTFHDLHRSMGGGETTVGAESLLIDAILCCILSPPTPRRTRIINAIMREPETKTHSQYHSLLEKIQSSAFLFAEDVQPVVEMLKDHHKTPGKYGLNALQRSLVEHNIISTSKFYSNISLHELASILGIAPAMAESIASQMISEGQLSAKIDQVDEVIFFSTADESVETMSEWRDQIDRLCALGVTISGQIRALKGEKGPV